LGRRGARRADQVSSSTAFPLPKAPESIRAWSDAEAAAVEGLVSR
jgi:hypothetical protein